MNKCRWHPSQKNKKLKDGSLELTFEVAGTKEIKTWILGFGSLAKVLKPASLSKEIRHDLEKSLRFYALRIGSRVKKKFAESARYMCVR